MTLAIDFDRTWTEDPALWRAFVAAAESRGHSVVMVTGRKAWSDDMRRGEIPASVRIIYAGDRMKQRAAEAAGVRVDVWIDDMPGTIQAVALLSTEVAL